MKHIILGSFIALTTFAFPFASHAQVQFGGLDIFEYPICDCVGALVPYTPPVFPPIYLFHFIVLLQIGPVPVPSGGFLAILIGMPLIYPDYELVSPSWVAGDFIPTITVAPPPICGFIAPGPPVGNPWCYPIPLPVFGVLDSNSGSSAL